MNERISTINDTLFFIQRGWLNGNHFVQVRPDVVLVDAGYLPDWPETEALINQTGARIEDTKHLICTHSTAITWAGRRILRPVPAVKCPCTTWTGFL
jgi:hypothetical protein